MFFDFFRKKAKEPQEIRFTELEKWLADSDGVKGIFFGFRSEIRECFSQLNESLDKIRGDIEQLKAVDLENRKVNEKVKEIVLQNKSIYIEHVQRLAAKLTEKRGTKLESLDEVEKFTIEISEYLDNFSKQSFKSFHIASELIGKELENVVERISAISSSIERIRSIDKEKIKAIMSARKSLEEIKENEKALGCLKNEIDNALRERQVAEKKISDAESENERIKESAEWKKKQDLVSNIKVLDGKLKENSSEALNLFLNIEKALKKWAWKEKDDRALLYLDNPIAMLKQDSRLEIMGILEKVKQDTTEDKLDLDEKKKDQVLKIIDSITREQLVYFINEENKIKRKIEDCWKDLSSHKIELVDPARLLAHKNDIISEIEKLGKRQRNAEQMISEKKTEIQEIMKAIADIKLVL